MNKSVLVATAMTIAALAASHALAQTPAGFIVQSLSGDLRLNNSQLAEGARGAEGTLTTGPGTQALLRFDDGMEVRLKENSALRLGKTVELQAGVAEFKTAPDRFALHTPQASLAALEPSDFAVAVHDSTIVDVSRGAVRVSSTLGDRVVREGATLAVPAAARSEASDMASSPQMRRGWVGISAGRSHIDGAAAEKLIDSGSVDESSTGFKIFGSYQFHRYIGAEAAYVDLGKLSYEGSFAGVPVTGGKFKLSGIDLSALGIVPLSARSMVFAKAGLFVWRAEASDTWAGSAFSSNTSGNDLSLGLGASFTMTGALALRAEIEDFRFAGHHARLLSLGLAYGF